MKQSENKPEGKKLSVSPTVNLWQSWYLTSQGFSH